MSDVILPGETSFGMQTILHGIGTVQERVNDFFSREVAPILKDVPISLSGDGGYEKVRMSISLGPLIEYVAHNNITQLQVRSCRFKESTAHCSELQYQSLYIGKLLINISGHVLPVELRYTNAAEVLLNTVSYVTKSIDPEAERRAMRLLHETVTQEMYHQYVMTGCICIPRHNSGLCYVVRRLFPTLVFTMDSSGIKDRFVGALCGHVGRVVDGSWSGNHCPTDDVLSHALLIINGEEARLWREANFHLPSSHLTGI